MNSNNALILYIDGHIGLTVGHN